MPVPSGGGPSRRDAGRWCPEQPRVAGALERRTSPHSRVTASAAVHAGHDRGAPSRVSPAVPTGSRCMITGSPAHQTVHRSLDEDQGRRQQARTPKAWAPRLSPIHKWLVRRAVPGHRCQTTSGQLSLINTGQGEPAWEQLGPVRIRGLAAPAPCFHHRTSPTGAARLPRTVNRQHDGVDRTAARRLRSVAVRPRRAGRLGGYFFGATPGVRCTVGATGNFADAGALSSAADPRKLRQDDTASVPPSPRRASPEQLRRKNISSPAGDRRSPPFLPKQPALWDIRPPEASSPFGSFEIRLFPYWRRLLQTTPTPWRPERRGPVSSVGKSASSRGTF